MGKEVPLLRACRFSLIALFLVVTACSTGGSSHSVSHDTAEAPVAVHDLDKEEIRKAIREHVVPIRHCYEKELKSNPKLAGKLVMEWDIGDLGKVTRVVPRQPFHPAVDECIAGVIKGTLFPSPSKGRTGNVIFPFVFSPNPDKAVK